jgi:hypothetical protein
MKRLLLAATCLTLVAPASLAGGFDKRLISAEADWVAHLDVEALLTSSLFQSILSLEGELDFENNSEYLELKAELGVDPLKVAKSLTLYGSEESPDEAIAILWATAEFDRVLERLKQEGDYRSFSDNGLAMHGWDEGGGDGGAFHVYTTSEGERLVVFAEDTDDIAAAVQVLTGGSPSLAQASEPKLKANPTVGSLLFVEAAGGLSALSGLDTLSTVAEMASGLMLEIGESRSRINLRLAVETESGEDARGITQIINGARALAAFAGGDMPQSVHELINAVRVQSRGTQVLIEFSYDTEQLMRDFEELGGHDAKGRDDQSETGKHEHF